MGSKFLINYLRQKWCDLQTLFVAPRLGCACAQPSCGLKLHQRQKDCVYRTDPVTIYNFVITLTSVWLYSHSNFRPESSTSWFVIINLLRITTVIRQWHCTKLHYVAGQEKEQKYVEHAANHGILLHSRRSLSAVQHSCRVGAKGADTYGKRN